MWKSGGSGAESGANQVPAPRSRRRALLQIVLTLVLAAAVIVFGFPLIFGLRVDVPAEIRFGSASTVMFQISNENLTPLTDVEYSCEVSKLTLADGSSIKDATVLNRGDIRKIAGRRAFTGRCQTAYLITAPLSAAEYKLTITYRAYPWPQQRTSVYRIAAEMNGKNEVTGWKLM
ncbi:MAG TPA: hypothetical protein VLY24_04110 [Bryobacteraceae bacterium]|nr:hypothetical protein [Bryobacteraceae bacterium]